MHVNSVTVCADRIDVIVRVNDDERLRTSGDEAMVQRALDLLPGLRQHICDNAQGVTFAEEITDTEVPHLFEHVVIELMSRAGSPRDLRGETQWDFSRDGHGTFRVSFEYDDDLVCLGAIKTADRVMAHILGDADAPDVDGETARLRDLRVRVS
ncbi:MAG: hypothetical protein JXE06_07315 [Coriobacteriia bacterium]|nr:hypothetical protein [Coriobacteriia bacterium]MBN2822210.1 hypothetical protein [Coriobacteriia bacterium]